MKSDQSETKEIPARERVKSAEVSSSETIGEKRDRRDSLPNTSIHQSCKRPRIESEDAEEKNTFSEIKGKKKWLSIFKIFFKQNAKIQV